MRAAVEGLGGGGLRTIDDVDRPAAVEPRARRVARGRLTGRHGRASLIVVALLVAGILAMHALTLHGTAPTPAVAGVAQHQSSAPRHAATPAGGEQKNASAHGSAQGMAHGADVLVLCALVLAAAALLGLLLTVIGRCRRVRLRSLDLPAALAPARRWVRGSGPPSARGLYVLRC